MVGLCAGSNGICMIPQWVSPLVCYYTPLPTLRTSNNTRHALSSKHITEAKTIGLPLLPLHKRTIAALASPSGALPESHFSAPSRPPHTAPWWPQPEGGTPPKSAWAGSPRRMPLCTPTRRADGWLRCHAPLVWLQSPQDHALRGRCPHPSSATHVPPTMFPTAPSRHNLLVPD